MSISWSVDSWKQCGLSSTQPRYSDHCALGEVVANLSSQPGVVCGHKVRCLADDLKKVATGRAFLLQLGDCAESFDDWDPRAVMAKCEHLQVLAAQMTEQLHVPVICMGRMAGQYGKPRTQSYEQWGGQMLPAYQGDLINQVRSEPAARAPNASRLQQAYEVASQIAAQLAVGGYGNIYTSHEAFSLFYEQGLTRCQGGEWQALSAHSLWLGMRSALYSDAHVEYLSGVANPIGIKIGPALSVERLCWIIERLNPYHVPGKLILIPRLGARQVDRLLSQFIIEVGRRGYPVIWSHDPMHGNTHQAQGIRKRRYLDEIQSELSQAIAVHKRHNSCLAGLHLESTYHDVMECLPSRHAAPTQSQRYTSLCDPRLNLQQAQSVVANFSRDIMGQGPSVQ